MTLVLLLGMGAGVAVAAVAFGLAPRPPPLAHALAELHRARPRAAPMGNGISHRLSGLVRFLGLPRLVGNTARADLAITGHDEDWYLSWAVLVGLLGLGFGPIVALVALLTGVALPLEAFVVFSLLAGPLAVASQLASVHADAERRRAGFVTALSAYLDLVVVSMASGRGVEGALSVAAETGTGFAFSSIRAHLAGARLRGIAPWDALEELGADFAISELQGLASSIRLAGASGAQVRRSIAARARALRSRALADARGAAESATERMSLPVVLLVMGFLILVVYPAVVAITTEL